MPASRQRDPPSAWPGVRGDQAHCEQLIANLANEPVSLLGSDSPCSGKNRSHDSQVSARNPAR